MPQSIKKGSLNSVFGIFPIAEDSLSESKDAILMGHHKARKCCCIASSGARQQTLFLVSHLSLSGLRKLPGDLTTGSGLINPRHLHCSTRGCCRCHTPSWEFVGTIARAQ
jgi:hypothetical protein